MSCFSKELVRSDGCEPDILHVATFSEPTLELITKRSEVLHLSFSQQFTIQKRPILGWKVCTESYSYAVDDENGQEILAFHWHPINHDIDYPHLHISNGAGRYLREEIRDIHFPTRRIAFEEFALMLIENFEIVPDKDDAVTVLNGTLAKFDKYKTWK
jgi:hypothetical protein